MNNKDIPAIYYASLRNLKEKDDDENATKRRNYK
jgi:hypothetical protein